MLHRREMRLEHRKVALLGLRASGGEEQEKCAAEARHGLRLVWMRRGGDEELPERVHRMALPALGVGRARKHG